MEFIQSFFTDKLDVDDREPFYTFTIPGEGEFGLFAPKGEFWKQLVVLLLLQIAIQGTFAIVAHEFIIRQRGTVTAYLVGWGIIVPLSLMIPYYLMETLDIRNKTLKLSAGNTMSILFFRSMETMYDTSPPVVESSLLNYILYNSTNAPCEWDEKTKTRRTVTISELAAIHFRFLFHFALFCPLLSYLLHVNWDIFESPVEYNEFHFNLDLLRPAHLANAYVHVVLVYLILNIAFDIVCLGENLKGVATSKIFDNPLFASRSPTEFWTKRWNKLIHTMLKFGTFKPAKKFVDTKTAIFITFIVSGLFHDYIWSVVFYNYQNKYDENGNCNDCYFPKFGRVSAFFLYTGVIMMLERPLGKFSFFQWTSKNLPTFVIATFWVLTHAPVAHWYYGDWMIGGYYKDFSIGLLHARKL